LNSSGLVDLAQGLSNEMTASAGLMGGANQIESVVAKLQKRPPIFEDPTTIETLTSEGDAS